MLTLEEALDCFRTEPETWFPGDFRAEGWEAVCGSRQDSKSACPTPLPAPRFVNQCGRCLEYRTATRVDLRGRSRIWLCDPCQTPTPPPAGTVGITVRTYQEAYRDLRSIVKAEEKERKRIEREAAKAARLQAVQLRKMGQARRKRGG